MVQRLAVYFPLADPVVGPEWLDIYADSGVDVVECGWPARDPYLDGPDVKASMARALGRDPAAALCEVRARLAGRAKVLVMTYAETVGVALEEADAVLVVGRPDDPRRRALEAAAREIAIFLPLPIADEDIEAARGARFYVMLQAAPGVTGPRAALDPANGERIRRLREEGVSAPILLGFGVSNEAHARAAAELGADGVVVGSAALRAALAGEAALTALLKDLRRGLDG